MPSRKSHSTTQNSSPDGPELSLILACYNEAEIFDESAQKIVDFLEKHGYSYELIFVEDKSRDKSRELVERFVKGRAKTKAIFHAENTGRGRAVSDGIRAAKGKIVGFIDIDLEVPIEQVVPLIDGIRAGADVAIGKRIYVTKLLFIHRHVLSRAYSLMSRVALGHNFSDTEAGCKFFNRRKILPFLSQAKTSHWFWDTEIVLRPYFAGLRVAEIPVLFIKNEKAQSTVKIFSDSVDYLKNLWKYSGEFRRLSRRKAP